MGHLNGFKEESKVYKLENLQILLEINILLLVGKHELFDIICGKNTFLINCDACWIWGPN